MGGDHAPGEVIYGALTALEDDPNLEVLLCGHEDRLKAALLPSAPRGGFGDERALPLPPRLKIVHAAHAIAMDEAPVQAVRQKPGSSIQRALELVQVGEADAFFSAGNTGAVCAAASLALRRIAGVRRPAIAVMLPTGGTATPSTSPCLRAERMSAMTTVSPTTGPAPSHGFWSINNKRSAKLL